MRLQVFKLKSCQLARHRAHTDIACYKCEYYESSDQLYDDLGDHGDTHHPHQTPAYRMGSDHCLNINRRDKTVACIKANVMEANPERKAVAPMAYNKLTRNTLLCWRKSLLT